LWPKQTPKTCAASAGYLAPAVRNVSTPAPEKGREDRHTKTIPALGQTRYYPAALREFREG
jgi:hypothetical protein